MEHAKTITDRSSRAHLRTGAAPLSTARLVAKGTAMILLALATAAVVYLAA